MGDMDWHSKLARGAYYLGLTIFVIGAMLCTIELGSWLIS